jgi:hypothetical protein
MHFILDFIKESKYMYTLIWQHFKNAYPKVMLTGASLSPDESMVSQGLLYWLTLAAQRTFSSGSKKEFLIKLKVIVMGL